jgi:hypothetical protein
MRISEISRAAARAKAREALAAMTDDEDKSRAFSA